MYCCGKFSLLLPAAHTISLSSFSLQIKTRPRRTETSSEAKTGNFAPYSPFPRRYLRLQTDRFLTRSWPGSAFCAPSSGWAVAYATGSGYSGGTAQDCLIPRLLAPMVSVVLSFTHPLSIPGTSELRKKHCCEILMPCRMTKSAFTVARPRHSFLPAVC